MKTSIRNKKGFTIVELVIVIAVIAILAAVLIPTFANLVEKANLSADEQAVHQMNTALAIYTAENGAPADYFELKDALDQNDINTDSLTPFSKGYSFYWDKTENEIVLVKEGDSVPDGAAVLNTNASENFAAAKINETTYNSLQAAIEAASENDTIVLQNDIKVNEPLTIGKTFTLDLNGKTIYNTEEIWSDDNKHWSLVSVTDGTLTIKDGTLRALANDCYAVDVRDTANLIIENGVFVGNLVSVYLIGSGTVTINGGTFSIQQVYYGSAANPYMGVLNRNDDASGKFVVNGGKFQNFNPSDSGEVEVSSNATITETKEIFGGVEHTYYVVNG